MGLLQIILTIFYCVWVIIKSIGGLQSQTMKVLGQAALSSLGGFVMNLIIYIMLDYAFCRVNMNKKKKKQAYCAGCRRRHFPMQLHQ